MGTATPIMETMTEPPRGLPVGLLGFRRFEAPSVAVLLIGQSITQISSRHRSLPSIPEPHASPRHRPRNLTEGVLPPRPAAIQLSVARAPFPRHQTPAIACACWPWAPGRRWMLPNHQQQHAHLGRHTRPCPISNVQNNFRSEFEMLQSSSSSSSSSGTPRQWRSIAIKLTIVLAVAAAIAAGIYFTVKAVQNRSTANTATSSGGGSGSSSSGNGSSSGDVQGRDGGVVGDPPAGTGMAAPVGVATGRPLDVKAADAACSAATCRLPDCYCAGTSIPGGLAQAQTPQFVSLTFDDYLSETIWSGIIEDLIYKTTARDATGCGPRLTFYLQNDLTDYHLVDSVYAAGSEIAIHTVDHANPTAYTAETWAKTMYGARRYVSAATSVPEGAMVGGRAPWLIYSDNMFTGDYRAGFLYDSSIVERHDSLLPDNSAVDMTTKVGKWLWPYTLDHGVHQTCPPGVSCVKNAYPGFWEVPMCVSVDFRNPNGYAAEMDPNMKGDDLYNLLVDNFDSRYQGNRAPYGIFLHAVSWLQPTPARVAVLQRFFEYAASHHGVVFATPAQIIRWMKDPKPIDQLATLPFMSCPPRTNTFCGGKAPNVCTFDQGRYKQCQPCPAQYPTLANAATPA